MLAVTLVQRIVWHFRSLPINQLTKRMERKQAARLIAHLTAYYEALLSPQK